ncbi:PAS domain-containing sensor histidine kinase [Flagellimonas flava]|uniref:histidine kinase n=1 Tax=Flagellimonas flava TaxID=570519 RepID=A0A1M5PE95_9FLAO|nr:PAS domain-containing protein [Allomuricauda flava]SHH00072.1 PAS domain S-box-containing protein [Allomuricauda flava]
MNTTKTLPYQYILKQLPRATALVDKNLIFLDASDSWFTLFESNRNQGADIYDFYQGHQHASKATIKKILATDELKVIRHKRTKNKEEQWFESSFTPWFDEQENLIGTIIQTMEISNFMEQELELDRVNTLLKTQSEVAKVGSWEYNIADEQLSWCKETRKIHGVDPDYQPALAEAINFYKRGYSRNRISMLFHKALEDGTPFHDKLIIMTQSGEERWVTAGGKAIKKGGKIIKLFGTFQDINDQVLAEEKIKESSQLLNTLIDNLPINVFIKDKDSRKILVNKAECDYLGTTPEELIGKTDFELYDKDIAQISRDEDLEVMRSQEPMLARETISVRKDGKATNFLTSKIPLLDINGKPNGLIGMSMDITNLKQKEDELRNLINVTAIQNKKLINFAHIVSHNLRSHTANFSMLLDFLVREKEELEKERILKMLSHASDNLLDTLENLNEVVDISTNVNLEKKSLNLLENITKVQQNLSAFLEENKVEFDISIPKNLNVMSVPAYLESILLNVVTNAVKYRSPDRKPLVELKAQRQDKQVVFSISDNGMGIDLERYGGKIFGMYKTFHTNKDARGLGLYIIKNQIEAMGGNITVNSEVNKGTTFNVYFNEEGQ